MPDTNLANAEDCRPLFDLMNQIRALAPWEWMEETDIFGVQHPDTGEIVFLSIMGMAGEHYAISAYQGAEGFYGFWNLQEAGPFMQPEDLLNTPQLQASFEDRDMLDKDDYNLIKSLGLKYRGRNAWPSFRSYRPGYAPWFIEAQEASILKYALEQVLIIAPRFKEDPDFLDTDKDDKCLVRVAQKDGDTLNWTDTIMSIEKPKASKLTIEFNPAVLDAVKRLPRKKVKIETDLFMIPTILNDKGDRPYFPYMLLMLDIDSGYIIGYEMFVPLPSLEDMWGKVGTTVLQQLIKAGAIPSEIRLRNKILNDILKSCAKDLKFKVKQVDQMPMLDMAKFELEGFMSRR